MKKLIALAVVAVAGAVVAADGYDFNATLKTTVGKSGKDSTRTYNLGMSPIDGKFWYEADPILLPTNLTTKLINGVNVPAVKKDTNGYYIGDDDVAWKLSVLENYYSAKSAGKWCDTVKVLTPAQCYRVAGTRKIKTVVANDICCSGINGYTNSQVDAFIDYSAVFGDSLTNSYINFQHFFGAQTEDKANKVEIFAHAMLPVEAGNIAAARFDGFIAGQGTFDVRNQRVTAISGNIVGAIDAPVCPNCCTAPTKALAFDCTTLPTGSTDRVTAAFGTFRMKYNKNIPAALYLH